MNKKQMTGIQKDRQTNKKQMPDRQKDRMTDRHMHSQNSRQLTDGVTERRTN